MTYWSCWEPRVPEASGRTPGFLGSVADGESRREKKTVSLASVEIGCSPEVHDLVSLIFARSTAGIVWGIKSTHCL